MLTQKDRQERGQAIVLMALALVGMLGFAAVALDGGNIYSEQRRAQAAADNAVLAGAYQYMSGITSTSTISNAALANAALNDYNNDSTGNWVRFYRPPIIGNYAGNSDYMQVVITERVPTALAHLVYKGPFQLTVNAIAYAKRGGPPVDGNAIVALNPTGCGIVQVNGSGNDPLGIATTGGGIFANSNGSECNGAGNNVIDTSGNNANITSAPPYGISVVATSGAYESGHVSPTPTTGVSQISSDPLSDLDPPTCAAGPGTTPSGSGGSGQTISPGTYAAFDMNNNSTLILSPGLYCINSSSNNAIDTAPGSVITGTGVTIYLATGGASLQQGTINLRAPSTTRNPECASLPSWEAPTTSVCHYIGMLFFLGRSNTSAGLVLNGQGDWNVEGTTYSITAPVTLSGNGAWSLTGQVLANNIVAGGNGTITVNFDPTVIYIPPPSISLMQ